MKHAFILITLILSSFASYAQDTIRKINGEEIIALVKEIDDESITYLRFDQPNGPLRKVATTQVTLIIYHDGTRERFTHTTQKIIETKPAKSDPEIGAPGTINTSGRTVIIHRKGPDIRVQPGDRFPGGEGSPVNMLRSGLYIDGMIGYAATSEKYNYYSPQSGDYVTSYELRPNLSFGLRFGSKIYFGANQKRRFGLNVAWVQLTGLVNELNRGDIVFAPVNFGFASVFSLGDHSALEVNTSTGMAVTSFFNDGVGIKYGGDVKFRYDAFAVGVDFSRAHPVFGNSAEYGNLFSVSLGFKL